MFIQTGGPLVACMLLCPKKMFVDNLGAPWSSGAWGPGPNGPVVNPPLASSKGQSHGGVLIAINSEFESAEVNSLQTDC